MHLEEWSGGASLAALFEGRYLSELGIGGRDRSKSRDRLAITSRGRRLAVEPSLMAVIRGRPEIVVMPVRRRSNQVGDLLLVLEPVLAVLVPVMLGGQVHPDTERGGAGCQPSDKDGDGEEALNRGDHAAECLRSPMDGQRHDCSGGGRATSGGTSERVVAGRKR